MTTPRIEINLKKIAHNARVLRDLFAGKGIGIMGVTNAICGDPVIADILVTNGINTLSDSRLSNIIRMRQAGVQAQFVLLRTPSLSQAQSVVNNADISINTELVVLEKLSKCALRYNKPHKVIIMVEMGDLRDGIMPALLDETIERINGLEGITLVGLGANLACFGGIKPDQAKIDLEIPKAAKGKELHLILEVWDKSDIVPLVDYRRVVMMVN